jgi:xanthine dehydrogenase small subunit
LHIGATATLAGAAPALVSIDPDLAEILRRFGSAQVREIGTVGGSIANASPIGDLAPLFIALGGAVELRQSERIRALPWKIFSPAMASRIAAPANSSGDWWSRCCHRRRISAPS